MPSQAAQGSSQVVGAIFPIIYIVMGAVYLHDCPRQPYIPIYLMVMGIVSLLMDVLILLPGRIPYMVLNGIIALFAFCWFIIGSVWIYSIYPPSYTKTTFTIDSNYNNSSIDLHCNKTLYLFAFWTNNVSCVVLGVSIVIGCLWLCVPLLTYIWHLIKSTD